MIKTVKHPVAIILIIVSILIVIHIIAESLEDNNHQRTRQLECQVKLEQIKQFGTSGTSEWNQVINKK